MSTLHQVCFSQQFTRLHKNKVKKRVGMARDENMGMEELRLSVNVFSFELLPEAACRTAKASGTFISASRQGFHATGKKGQSKPEVYQEN